LLPRRPPARRARGLPPPRPPRPRRLGPAPLLRPRRPRRPPRLLRGAARPPPRRRPPRPDRRDRPRQDLPRRRPRLGRRRPGPPPVGAGAPPPPQRPLARLVLRGDQIALALTERGHGSDLLGTEVEAAPGPGGYRLRGEKWLVNNATRGRALTVFARTDPAGG